MALAARSDQLAETNENLDRGLGACWLKEPAIAAAVETTLLYFDGERYRVLSWCIMPNRVHVVIEVIAGIQLGSIVRSWKSFTASQANQILGRSGAFGTEITSIGSFATKATLKGPSTTLRIIL